jgi:hypothetical protein
MSIRIYRDQPNRLIRVAIDGLWCDSALLDGYMLLKDHIAQCGPANCIIDYSDVVKITTSANTIRYVASQASSTPVDCLLINVAPVDLAYGLARMFQILGSEHRPNFRVVRTIKEALDLVGVPSPNFSLIVESLHKAA